jgi:hypothetical protein
MLPWIPLLLPVVSSPTADRERVRPEGAPRRGASLGRTGAERHPHGGMLGRRVACQIEAYAGGPSLAQAPCAPHHATLHRRRRPCEAVAASIRLGVCTVQRHDPRISCTAIGRDVPAATDADLHTDHRRSRRVPRRGPDTTVSARARSRQTPHAPDLVRCAVCTPPDRYGGPYATLVGARGLRGDVLLVVF